METDVFYSIGLPAISYGHLIVSDAETLSYYTSTEMECEGYIGITIKMTNNLLILCYSVTLRTVFTVLTHSVACRQKRQASAVYFSVQIGFGVIFYCKRHSTLELLIYI